MTDTHGFAIERIGVDILQGKTAGIPAGPSIAPVAPLPAVAAAACVASAASTAGASGTARSPVSSRATGCVDVNTRGGEV